MTYSFDSAMLLLRILRVISILYNSKVAIIINRIISHVKSTLYACHCKKSRKFSSSSLRIQYLLQNKVYILIYEQKGIS